MQVLRQDLQVNQHQEEAPGEAYDSREEFMEEMASLRKLL